MQVFMNAVVDIQGKQFRVSPGDRIRAPRLKEEPGSKISLDRVLLVDDGPEITVGKPLVEGATVESIVEEHRKARKVIVFKMRRRKDSRVKNGHRQPYTLLKIGDIKYSGAGKAKAPASSEVETKE